MADQPLGNPPVMVHDIAGNAVIDPREIEKPIALAEASRQSNDAKEAQQQAIDAKRSHARGAAKRPAKTSTKTSTTHRKGR